MKKPTPERMKAILLKNRAMFSEQAIRDLDMGVYIEELDAMTSEDLQIHFLAIIS